MGWTSEDYIGMRHVCGYCGKVFITDNAWIVCKHPPDKRRTIEARFCSGKCRAHYLIDKGWTLDCLNRLRPPGEDSGESL